MRRLLTLLLIAASLGLVVRGAVPCEALSAQPACVVGILPGPANSTYASVEIEGVPTFASSGELALTTVRPDARVNLGEWIRYGLDARVDLADRSLYVRPDESLEEAERRNEEAMARSQLVAALAALRQLGYQAPVGAEVVEVVEGTPAAEIGLRPGDVVTSVDGVEVDSATALIEVIRGRSIGDQIEVGFVRDGQQRRAEVTLAALPSDTGGDEAPRPSLGVRVRAALPVDVTIDAGRVGGPSAGLMFALTIIDLLSEQDLTGGKVIAGTGTITPDGRVGPIGGIRQKVLGALERGEARPADVFLVPRDNFDEARTAPVDNRVLLVPVATLGDALDALAELRAGREPASALAVGG